MTSNLKNAYPNGIKFRGPNVFYNGRYVGVIDTVANWGRVFAISTDYDSRSFNSRREAVFYLCHIPYDHNN